MKKSIYVKGQWVPASPPVGEITTFSELLGARLERVTVVNNDEVHFELSDGRRFKLFHYQDCCESVNLEEIDGTIEDRVLVDLVGEVLLATEESKEDDKTSESGTWTFYRIQTAKGFVVLRWLGTSNGYYSERVSFEEVK